MRRVDITAFGHRLYRIVYSDRYNEPKRYGLRYSARIYVEDTCIISRWKYLETVIFDTDDPDAWVIKVKNILDSWNEHFERSLTNQDKVKRFFRT